MYYLGGKANESFHQPRRSIVEMERALQSTIESATMSKKSLYKEVVKANANITPISNASNHLAVSPQSLPSIKSAKKFDLKLICPHGIYDMIDAIIPAPI